MTNRSFAIFGASLLSLAVPALAEETRPPRVKTVPPTPAVSKPLPGKAERHKPDRKSEDRDDERGEKHDAERRHDRD